MNYIELISNNIYVPIILQVIIFLLVLYSSYKAISFILERNLIQKSADGFYQKTQENENKRKNVEELLKREEGLQEKRSFLQRLDDIVTYSNLRKTIPFINAEIFLMFCGILAILTFFIVCTFAHWLVAIVGSIFSIVIVFLTVIIMATRSYKKVEDNIMSFINLMENYSKTSDDIVSIIGKISHYSSDPLKTALEECYAECMSTGNTTTAFENLSSKISHGKFKEIIRNIIICSRYEANYGEIVSESRNVLRDYLLDKKEKAALLNNARVELGLILVCSLGMIYMINGFTSRGVVPLLTDNIIGICVLGYNIIVITIAIFSVMFMGHSED